MAEDRGYEQAARFYDLFDRKNNINFYYRYAKEAGVILDIGAGTGRIAEPLTEKGVKVICIEPSPAMRREFIKKINKNPKIEQNIVLIAADAKSFDLKERFQVAFLSSSFDHFMNNKERISSLININHHLKYGGKLIFDVSVGIIQSSPLKLVDVIKKNNNLEYHRLIKITVLPNKKLKLLLVYKVYEKGELKEIVEQKSAASIIAYEEVHYLLDQTGFIIKKEYSSYDFSPYQKGDPLLIVEARKMNEK